MKVKVYIRSILESGEARITNMLITPGYDARLWLRDAINSPDPERRIVHHGDDWVSISNPRGTALCTFRLIY